VAATSANDVFAVGSAPEGSYRALLLHWNGHKWTCALTANRHRGGTLVAVAASSPDNAWAVGDSGEQALALHWNGRSWNQVTIPHLGWGGSLRDVDFLSQSGTAWAIGGRLLLRWDGTAWR
jgi:hypothetical protein